MSVRSSRRGKVAAVSMVTNENQPPVPNIASPIRSSKRRKNAKVMDDDVTAIYIPPLCASRSNTAQNRITRITSDDIGENANNILIDTSNFSRRAETTLIRDESMNTGVANLFNDSESQIEADLARSDHALPEIENLVQDGNDLLTTQALDVVTSLDDVLPINSCIAARSISTSPRVPVCRLIVIFQKATGIYASAFLIL
jgi:hypothetical protein